jgi:large subunit ribosomal protein L15
MRIDDLKPADGAFTPRKRVGRGHGSGHVKTAGRGTKGQNSRSGGGVRPGFEGGQNPIYRRMPYKRGFHNRFAVEYEVVNLTKLARLEQDSPITPESLYERGVTSHRTRPVKILGTGSVTGAIHIRAHKFSESARAKIEAAGGTAEVID